MLLNYEMEKRVNSEHPSKIKALIREWNGGRYGKSAEYIAVIEPEYFKNGSIKKGSFRVIEVLETTKKGYRYGNANHSEQIADILEILA